MGLGAPDGAASHRRTVIETTLQALPHGITLGCRSAGQRGRPVLMFLHGFPQGAFVWDALLGHFAQAGHGGFRCVAPYLRGFGPSSAPPEVSAYRPKHLVQDIAALIAIETEQAGGQLAALVAHDWGGAIAWNLANQLPQLTRGLAIINSPHPGTFLRELNHNPAQQAASAYMNFLARPDAPALLAQDDYRRLWRFFTTPGSGQLHPPWLTEGLRAQHRQVWAQGLQGPCHYYGASPLRPPTPQTPAPLAVALPRDKLTVDVPTQVIWGLDDVALPPALLNGLGDYVRQLEVQPVAGASHWLLHENPALVQQLLTPHLLRFL